MFRVFFVLFFLSSLSLAAENKDQKICLNMIIKDESKVIGRCLSSLKNIIDYWVIVDTGSTDGTQDIVRELMKDIPGELHERPWENFEHNRNEALVLAKNKGDYVLFIDADERLSFSGDFVKPNLDQDYYFASLEEPACSLKTSRILLINMQKDWKWLGAIHERLISEQAKSSGYLSDISCVIDTSSSARSQDPLKYMKDAKILEDALEKDPNNSRYVFYLAQSYANAEEYTLALKNYEKRATMKGNNEEVFWSLFIAAKIKERLKFSHEIIVSSYSAVSEQFPARAEPLFHLANYFIAQGNGLLSYLTAQLAFSLPEPKEIGYVEPEVYEFGSMLILANSAYKLNKYKEALSLYQKLLLKENLPQVSRDFVLKVSQICLERTQTLGS